MIRVPFGRREISPQFLSRTARTVSGGIPLDAPPFFERACVHSVETELIEQMGNGGLGALIITSNHQRATILRPRRLPVGGEFGGVNVIEALTTFEAG